jgi:two-component system chemotaxis response regulator CheB
MAYEAIVLGVSAGGLAALGALLPALPASFALPIAIVQHVGAQSDGYLAEFLDRASAIGVKEAEDKELMQSGTAYLAPPGYHLLVERDRSLALSVDGRVNHCCPSIDVLFESAAAAFGPALIGVILTGANRDGAEGLRMVRQQGGLAIVQNPDGAQSPVMPRAALDAAGADHVLPLDHIAPLLMRLAGERDAHAG